jgi:hypothetical protein
MSFPLFPRTDKYLEVNTQHTHVEASHQFDTCFRVVLKIQFF